MISRTRWSKSECSMQNTFGHVMTFTGMVVGLLIGLLSGTAGAAGDVFFACARNNGTLMPTITLNIPPNCPGNTTLVSWSAEAPPLYIISANAQVAINETKMVVATCDPGDRVQAGGWQVQPVGLAVETDVLVSMDQPSGGPPSAPTSWAVRVKNISTNAVLLIVFADCIDLTP